MASTYFFVLIGWVFFRSESIGSAFEYLLAIPSTFQIPLMFKQGVIYTMTLLVLEWLMRKDERSPLKTPNQVVNWILYSVILFMIMIYMDNRVPFIYFQF